MKKTNDTILYGSFIILQCLIWGIGNPLVKISLKTVSPFYCLGTRFSIAFFLYVLIYRKKLLERLSGRNLFHGLVVSLFSASSFILSNYALYFSAVTVTGFLMALSVIFTPFLSWFFIDHKFDKRLFAIVIIVVAGMYFLCSNDKSFSFGPGEIMALLSSFAVAVTLVYSAKYMDKIGIPLMSTMQTGVTAVISMVLALVFEDFHVLFHAPVIAWSGIIYLAVGCTVIAYLLQNTALSHVPASFVSLALCSEPVFTAAAAYVMLGETLSLSGLTGSVLILIGIVAASILPDKRT